MLDITWMWTKNKTCVHVTHCLPFSSACGIGLLEAAVMVALRGKRVTHWAVGVVGFRNIKGPAVGVLVEGRDI